MSHKWRCYVVQEDVVGARIIAIRVSDNVLDEEDWPVHILKFHEDGVCVQQTVENEGVYKMDDFVGKDLNALIEWSNCDLIDSRDEISHDLCIFMCF